MNTRVNTIASIISVAWHFYGWGVFFVIFAEILHYAYRPGHIHGDAYNLGIGFAASFLLWLVVMIVSSIVFCLLNNLARDIWCHFRGQKSTDEITVLTPPAVLSHPCPDCDESGLEPYSGGFWNIVVKNEPLRWCARCDGWTAIPGEDVVRSVQNA
jgi:hypothetical protein